MTSRSLRRALFVASMLVVGPALAEPSAEDHERARSLLAEGRARRANSNPKGALESFLQAHAIENLSTTGLEVGKTLVALGRLVEARDLLVALARSPAQAGEPPPVTSARADAHALADSLERRIPTLAIKITGQVDPSVSATVDGVAVAVELLEQPRRVDPGTHIVVVHARGLDRMVDVTVAEAENKEIAIAVPQAGSHQDPVPPPPPPPPPPAPHPGPSHTLAWIGGAAAVAGLTVGSITGLTAITKTNDLEPLCKSNSCPPDQYGELREAKTIALVSTISFIVAGAGVALVVWDLVRTPSSNAAAIRINERF